MTDLNVVNENINDKIPAPQLVEQLKKKKKKTFTKLEVIGSYLGSSFLFFILF